MWNERDEQHAEGARRALREAADSTKQRAGSVLHDQKERAAGSAHAVADALRSSADSFRQSNSPSMASYLERAAHQVDEASQRLRGKDFDFLMGATEDYARRQPAVFLGASVAVGLALGRFLKSSSARRQRASQPGPAYRPAHDAAPRYDGPAAPVQGDGQTSSHPESLEY